MVAVVVLMVPALLVGIALFAAWRAGLETERLDAATGTRSSNGRFKRTMVAALIEIDLFVAAVVAFGASLGLEGDLSFGLAITVSPVEFAVCRALLFALVPWGAFTLRVSSYSWDDSITVIVSSLGMAIVFIISMSYDLDIWFSVGLLLILWLICLLVIAVDKSLR